MTETPGLTLRSCASITDIDAAAWNALIPDANPFADHAFLRALESSGSVGAGRGWQGFHLALEQDGRLLAAAPAWIKGHSRGEYIFDWAWANAAHHFGVDYYPKLLLAIPFTPASAPTLLAVDDQHRRLLAAQVPALADQLELSSAHLLFLDDEDDAACDGLDLIRRRTHQFHWHNHGHADFDDYLASLKRDRRKKIRQERRRVAEQGIEIVWRSGRQLDESDWHRFESFYQGTCARYGAEAYLHNGFFADAAEGLGERIWQCQAWLNGDCVATALFFNDAHCLYGRYWGAVADIDCLHFELCYYAPIARAIELGFQRFEAGAQGEHKIWRGLEPSAIQSAHWIREPNFRRAIAAHVASENAWDDDYREIAATHLPHKTLPTA